MKNNILSLLGLALRGGRLAVGEEPAALAAKAGQARLILLASDAADNTVRRGTHLAEEGRCLYLTLPASKAELGGALGRGSAAIAALTDTGLAAAVTERLAALDPERYGEIAARMDLKRRRAKERQAAPHRDPPRKEAAKPENRRPGERRRASGRDGPADRRDGSPRDRREDLRETRNPRPGGDRPRGGRPEQAGGGKPARSHEEGRPRNGKRPYQGTRSRPQGGKQGRPPWNRGGTGPGPRSGKGGPDRDGGR